MSLEKPKEMGRIEKEMYDKARRKYKELDGSFKDRSADEEKPLGRMEQEMYDRLVKEQKAKRNKNLGKGEI